MSLLAPLYFFGALAVGLPILFHLIRRQPRGQVEFSSLMFLRPTPPRLTRRSRLDNWFLLLLRALALTLLAAAFTRPFLRSIVMSEADLPGRRIVLMLDTSASMQRSGLWQQAQEKAAEVLADLQPSDSLALVTFDSEPNLAVGFDESLRMNVQQVRSAVQRSLREATPSWRHTDLGRAISFAGDIAVNYETDPNRQQEESEEAGEQATALSAGNTGPAHLILITDMQSGSQIESLQVYAWPKELRLEVRKVAPQRRANASAQILVTSSADEEDPDRVRVRVANAADSEAGKFSIAWSTHSPRDTQSGDITPVENELPVQVPPGQTRVVRMPTPPPGVDSLILKGDEHSFDNTRFVVSPEPVQLAMHYVGPDVSDPRESLLYYLQRVPLQNARRGVTIETIAPEAITEAADPRKVPLVVLAQQVGTDATESLRQFMEQGGRVLVVLPEKESAQSIVDSVIAISSSPLQVGEAEIDDYVMLTKIDFGHPLFQPMADPQFNDFSKIRFWAHRSLGGIDDSWDVIASFDDGDPALIERSIGKGRLFVLATGWQPLAGQLALSTKFIPLVHSLFDLDRRASQSDQYLVGEPIDYLPSDTATISGPAGIEFAYRSAADLDGIDQPGVYTYRDGEESRVFAVNLSESESRTEAIGEDALERFGVILGKNVTTEQALQMQRQLRDRELESQQKLWQWILIAALGILGLETLLGGWFSRRQTAGSLAAGASQ